MVADRGGTQASALPDLDEACAALVRALSGVATARARLPQGLDVVQLRLAADHRALRLRYHDDRLHRRLRPQEPARALLFDALEQARFHALGARRWAGVQRNLLHSLTDYARVSTRGEASAQEAAQRLFATAAAFLAGSAPRAPAEPLVRRRLQGDFAFWERCCARLKGRMGDQAGYALIARALLRRLDTAGWETPEVAAQPQADLQDAPVPDAASADDAQASRRAPNARRGRRRRPAVETRAVGDYRIFTRAFDEAVPATALLPDEARRRRRRELDALARRIPGWRRWMQALEQALSVRVVRPWVRESHDDGRLNHARLARLVASPTAPVERVRPGGTRLADAALTLLVDNSASMHGRPIELAAVCADLLAAALCRAGVTVEVLGFTTVFGRDNACRDEWRAAGSPPRPGRLNAVRHVVYKAAARPWRTCRGGMGVMLEPGLLRENVDGEALAWAYRRLCRRREARRVLVVLCDGAPDDNATLSANRPDYLVRHLRAVVARIEAQRRVELTAIGIGYDVSRFYPRSVTLRDARELAPALSTELIALLSAPARTPA